MTRSGKQVNSRQAKLKQKRSVKTGITLWRSLIAVMILTGIAWLLIRPHWIIRDSSQIDIENNQLLSDESIRNMVSLSYPQSIFQIPIPKLDQQLEKLPPLKEVQVTRELLPPKLTINIVERLPVAIAFDSKSPQDSVGFLDQEGIILPEKFYHSVKAEFTLPKLKVIGFKGENGLYWSKLYQSINQSKIEVKEIDWRNSDNLILTTELGKIHLGSNQNLLKEQLKVLEEMAALPSKLKIQEIDYIDLSKPTDPLIQVFKIKEKETKNKELPKD